ncbi:uncharacterized protein LOC110064562 [Orbicella faveolata]|uniref:uncharacterized protein LOC110064562 n=1 Tax=Orbicella faveolata TaxID=48498 RepID=UPI0009E5CD97|nr:uncharacterized protein LOC110064562 [Orbicella faveolata]
MDGKALPGPRTQQNSEPHKSKMFVAHFVRFALILLICRSEFCHGEEEQQAKDKLQEALKSVEEYKVRNKRAAPCKDGYHDCSIYKPYCKHNSYKEFVSKYCKKTCNLCPKRKLLIFLLYNNLKDMVLPPALLMITSIEFFC